MPAKNPTQSGPVSNMRFRGERQTTEGLSNGTFYGEGKEFKTERKIVFFTKQILITRPMDK